MIRRYETLSIIRWCYPSLIWKKASSDAVYLTFDDGPNEATTPWVLKTLERAGAKATFFCVGRNLVKNRKLVTDILNRGHLIANHTYSHLNGMKVTNQQYLDDVKRCDEVLHQLGVTNNYFRPPYGRIRRSQLKLLNQKQKVMWSHLSWDFDARLNIDQSRNVLEKADPGSILTFHDSDKAIGNLKKMLPSLLDHLVARGLKFNRIDE